MSSETNLQLFPGVFRSTVGGENPGFFLHSDGRVGIGNKAPTTRPLWSSDDTDRNKLNVTGHTHIDGNLNVTGHLYGDGSNLSGVAAVVGGYWDLDQSNNNISYSAGNVGIGTDDPQGGLHVQADNRVHITAGTVAAFTGTEASSSTGTSRAQLVLNSRYSDLVIASSYVNNSHGSTLSFATVNPSNTAEYRKFVINQGNWGSRKDFLDFGLSVDDGVPRPNPHSSINSTDTVLTLDGNNKRVGIGTINPGYKLHVYDSSATHASWSNFYVRPTSLWGDGLTTASETAGTKYMTMGQVMLQNPHITPSSTGGNATIRYGRAGGVASGNWWETACLTDGSFRIRREATNDIGITINSSGRVGIGYGTIVAADRLAVNGRTYTVGLYNASDDRIKYNETDIPNSLDLVNQLKPKKYDKLSTFPPNLEGHWIPTDEEWENVKDSHNHLPEFGFIAQDVRKIPELEFLVSGDEIRVTQKDISLDEYNELASTERDTYTPIYMHSTDKTRIGSEDYTRLSIEEQGSYNLKYTKRIESQTPLSVDYISLSVLTASALQEVDRQLQTTKEELQAEKEKVKSLEERLAALEAIVLNQ